MGLVLLGVIFSQYFQEGLQLGPSPLDSLAAIVPAEIVSPKSLTPDQIQFIRSPLAMTCIQQQLQILFSAGDVPRELAWLINVIPIFPLIVKNNAASLKLVQPSDKTLVPSIPINVKGCAYAQPTIEIPPNYTWKPFPENVAGFISKSLSAIQPGFDAVLQSAQKNAKLDPAFLPYVKYVVQNAQQLWLKNAATFVLPSL